jgi:hypothetical protein
LFLELFFFLTTAFLFSLLIDSEAPLHQALLGLLPLVHAAWGIVVRGDLGFVHATLKLKLQGRHQPFRLLTELLLLVIPPVI